MYEELIMIGCYIPYKVRQDCACPGIRFDGYIVSKSFLEVGEGNEVRACKMNLCWNTPRQHRNDVHPPFHADLPLRSAKEGLIC